MYHHGGWHHGRQQMDTPPPRSHRSRPYRGGYHDHREHDQYGSYRDIPCHDRNYNDNQFMEYPDHSYPEYYEEKQSFIEYREHREPAYNRGGRHDGGYHRETYSGGYQRGRGESSQYRGNVPEAPPKKYSHKPFKGHKKENEIQLNTSIPQPVEKVIHNSGPTIVTLTPGITEDKSETTVSKAKSPEQDANPSEDCEKPLQETAKLERVKDVKVDCVVNQIMNSPSDQRNEILPAANIKTEITEFKKEDNLQAEQTVKEELPISLNPEKRAHLEEEDFGVCVEQREGESFVGKRLCSSQERDEHYLEQTVQIPLLGYWGDMPSELPSESAVSPSTSEQENSVPAVDCKLPEIARELRTAFILARKDQLEVAFAQDCKTFAVVANTLLKKDPSIEAAVTTALRSSLQEMAGLCVQELNNFIDNYDSGV